MHSGGKFVTGCDRSCTLSSRYRRRTIESPIFERCPRQSYVVGSRSALHAQGLLEHGLVGDAVFAESKLRPDEVAGGHVDDA